MSVGINNNYNLYYAQVTNNSKSNTDKTSVDDNITSTTDKVTSEEDYFKNLRSNYPNVNLNMSDLYLGEKNKITVNISPSLIKRAMNDPEAAKKLNDLMNQMPEFTQFINAHKYTPDGREVTSVSFVIDKDGGCSCMCEYKEQKTKKSNESSYMEKLRKKKIKELREISLKKAQEKEVERIENRRTYPYHKNVTKVFNINLLDKNV